MTAPRAGLVMLGLLLAGCSGMTATEPGPACADELHAANRELEDARAAGFAGSIQWIKAANLLAAAEVRRQVEKYDSCLEKVRRARVFIREAQK